MWLRWRAAEESIRKRAGGTAAVYIKKEVSAVDGDGDMQKKHTSATHNSD